MMSQWLRRCLGAEAVLLILASTLLVRAGHLSAGTAAALAIGAFFAVNSCPLIVIYALAFGLAGKEPAEPKVGMLRAWRGAIDEWLAYLLLYLVIQPFEQWWMGSDAVGRSASGRLPVLLVHGYLCNRGLWWRLRRRLRAQQFPVATINLLPPLADIDGFVEQLHARIEALLAETGADRVVLVAHSMGGLVARAYLLRHGPNRVAKLITLAAPHQGTRIAHFGLGLNARQMEPDSPWIRGLASREPSSVPAVNLWSAVDEIVVPPHRGRWAGVHEKVMPALGHFVMVFSPTVAELVQRELAVSAAANSASRAIIA
ncbi:MAG: esterase/lipase family protein [Xanthobacteraceae bacterium]